MTAPEKKSVRRWWASIRDGAERHNLFADKTRADMETVAGPFANRQTIEFVLAADYDAERRAAEEMSELARDFLKRAEQAEASERKMTAVVEAGRIWKRETIRPNSHADPEGMELWDAFAALDQPATTEEK